MFKGKQYYGLVAGLREYTLDAVASSGGAGASAVSGSGGSGKEFDSVAIYGEIRRELSPADRRAAGLLWSLSNIYGLGRERIEWLYSKCELSKCDFLRSWGEFDRNLRNVIAAYTARGKKMPVEDALLKQDEDENAGSSREQDDVAVSLIRSTAADFSLKGELEYIDSLLAAMDETDMVEKERAIDLIRWKKAEELAEFDSFGVSVILAYLVKIAILGRWAVLDTETGREMYDALVGEISSEIKM